MAVKGDIVLKDQDKSKLDSIVMQMVNNKEPDENIQAVVNDFKSIHGQKGTTVPSASQQSVKKSNNAPPTAEDIMSIKTAIGAGGNKPTSDEISKSFKKEKPLTPVPAHQKNIGDTPEHIDQQARTKLDEIMYADDSRWKDPLRSVYESYFNSNEKDRAVINRAAELTQRSLMPDGFEAKKLLQSTHLGKEGNDNMTATELRNKAQEYDKTTAPLREIQLQPESYDENENAKRSYADLINNAAIKWWADKNPDFKRQLGNSSIDINDKDLAGRVGSAKAGQILHDYLSDGNVQAYVDKENPHMKVAADYAGETNITKNKDWGVNQVANEVSQEIQKSGYNKAEPIFNYWGKGSQAYANLTAETMYGGDPQKLEIYNKYIRDNQHEYLDAPSFFEGASETAKDLVTGIGHTITTPFRSREKDIKDEWRKEAMHVSSNPDGYIGLIRDTGRATGFVLSLAAGGEALQGAKLVTNAMTAQKVLVGMSFFGDELRAQEMKYESPVKAWSVAALNTGGFVMLNNIFPAAKARAAFNEVSPELSAIMENLTAGKITKEVARGQANNAFKKAIDFGTKGLLQNTKMSLEMTGLTAGSKIVDKIFGLDDKTFDKYHPKDEEAQAFASIFLSNGVVASLSAYGEINKRSHALENSWWEVANKPKTYMRIADAMADRNPQMSKTEMWDNIKFLHETKKHLDQRGIPAEQQKEYLSAAMKQRVMEANVATLPDESMKKEQGKSIANQQKIKEAILKGEPVPEELYEQYKPKTKNTSVILPSENKAPNIVPLNRSKESKEEATPIEKVPSENNKEGTLQEKMPQTRWYRGVNKANEKGGDTFYSADESIAGDYSIDKVGDEVRKTELSKEEQPKNPLMVGSKEELADKIGYEGDPLAEPLDTPKEKRFDTLAKQYAQEKGHDAIVYESGTMDEPELHLFEKTKPIEEQPTEVGDIKIEDNPNGGKSILYKGKFLGRLGPTSFEQISGGKDQIHDVDVMKKVLDDLGIEYKEPKSSTIPNEHNQTHTEIRFKTPIDTDKITTKPQPTEVKSELSPEQKLIQSAIDNKEVKGAMGDMAKAALESPETAKQFISDVKDQATNKGGGFTDEQALQRAKDSFGESLVNHSIAADETTEKNKVPVSAEGEGATDTEPDKTVKATEKTPGDPTSLPPRPREVAGSPKQEWVAIRKEKMQEIASVKDLYERQSGKKWTEVEERAMGDLQAEYPDKTLYEAARDKVYKMADMFDKGADFNPSTAELAQIKYFLAETKQRRANVGDWASEDDITRLRALDDWKKTNDDLLAIGKALNPSEAGRAFGYRQSESTLDPDNGLTTRRMELMGAKGGERLSDEEMKWTSDMWDKEKDLMEREQAAKEESLKESFIKQVQKLQEDFDKRVKQSKGTAPRTKSETRENILNQGGKDFADKLRSGKLKGGTYSTIPGFPQTINLVIEAVAQIVEKGATLAQAISNYAKKHDIKDEAAFRENFLDVLEKRDKGNTAFDKMKEDVKLSKVNGITKEVVKKNYIRDYVNAHIGEHDPKDVLKQATKGLKEIYPDVTEEQVRDAYLKKGDYKIETQKKLQTELDKGQRSLSRILKIEKDIDDLRNKKILHRENGNLSAERGVDSEIEKRQKELKREMVAQGKKYSGEDKYKKASYDTRAKSHNDRLDKLSKNIDDKIKNGGLSKEQEAKLTKLKDQVDNAKIKLDPDSRLSQKDVVDHGLTILKNIQAEFNKSVKPTDANQIGDYRRQLQSAIDLFDKDKDASEQDIKLKRTKDSLRSGNDEIARQINAGEFEHEPPTQLNKSDAELVKLQVERNKLDSQYRAKEKEVADKNKSFIQKAVDVVRGAYVFALIYKFGTLAKVGVAAALRPQIEAFTKLTFGNIAKVIFPKEIMKQARAGGESSSWRTIGKMYAGLLRQMGPEKLAALYEKANARYEASEAKYQDAIDPETRLDDKDIQKLKNQRDNDLLDAVGNIMYQYMGGSSIKDAIDALLHRSNVIEREFGFLDKETIKDGTVADKINYVLGFMGRSHSALKTFSGRSGFAGSFMARLEAAQMDGIDISDPDVQLKLGKDAYIDWDRGKYQQSNFVSDAWNKIIQKLDKAAQGESWEKYYKALGTALRFDVAITRVPVNILHESVAEYTLGAFRSMFDAGNEYRKARREVRLNQNIMPDEKGFKEAVKKELSNMDAQKAATIVRCFRKGGFGLGMFALLAVGGLMKYGGFHHKGEKKKTEEEKEAGELDPGEVMVGDQSMGKLVSKIIEHTPSMYLALLGLNSAKIYQDKIDEGKDTFEGAMGALISDLEEMQDAIPQSEIIKPLTLTEKVTTGTLHQLDKAWEWNDVDQDGNLIERKPIDFRDELNMLLNHRDQVLTKENYGIAKSILSDFKTAIREAHKSGASKEEIDELKKDRDEQIKQIYELNSQKE